MSFDLAVLSNEFGGNFRLVTKRKRGERRNPLGVVNQESGRLEVKMHQYRSTTTNSSPSWVRIGAFREMELKDESDYTQEHVLLAMGSKIVKVSKYFDNHGYPVEIQGSVRTKEHWYSRWKEKPLTHPQFKLSKITRS